MTVTRDPTDLTHEELDRFWAQEIERRKSRTRSWAASLIDASGTLATPIMFFGTSITPGQDVFGLLGAAGSSGLSSLWLAKRGVTGLWDSRPLPPPPTHRLERSASRRGKNPEKETEWQVLEILQRHGEITPTRVALETNRTVDEAQRKLSELAEKGHVDVRVEGSKLVYSL